MTWRWRPCLPGWGASSAAYNPEEVNTRRSSNVATELGRCRERVQRLEAVIQASALVNSTLDLKELAEHVIGIATRLVGAERGSLFLVDREAGTLESLVAQGINQRRLVLDLGEGIVGAVAESGEALILNEPYGDPRFDRSVDQKTGFRTRSLLTVPVRDRDGTLAAVLQLLNRDMHHPVVTGRR